VDRETKVFLAHRIARNVIKEVAEVWADRVTVNEYIYSEFPGLDGDVAEDLAALVRSLLQVIGSVSFQEYRIKADGSIMTEEEYVEKMKSPVPPWIDEF